MVILRTLISALVLSVTSITNSGDGPFCGVNRNFKISDEELRNLMLLFLFVNISKNIRYFSNQTESHRVYFT